MNPLRVPSTNEPTSPSGATDADLVRRARAGDADARRELAERFRFVPRFLAVLNRRRGSPLDRHALEDLSQDTVAAAWSRIDTFNGASQLETWLYSYCVNTLSNALRKRAVRARPTPGNAESESLPAALHDDVHAALSRLAPEAETVIRMRFFEDWSFPDIASRIHHPIPTVKAWYYRGLERLARELRGDKGGKS